MAVTGFGPVIQLPTPALRDVGLLLDNIPRPGIDSRWPLGVKFQPFDFTALLFNDSDCAPTNLPGTNRTFPTVVEQPAFSIWDAVKCSTLWMTPQELEDNVRYRWPNLISYAFAQELLTSNASGGHSLQDDDVDLGASASVQVALAEAEEFLALNLKNSVGLVHMSPSLLAYAVANNHVFRRGNTYYTPGGHIVIADAGYQVAETTTSVMYVTGPVFYAMTDVESLGAPYSNLDRTHNDYRALQMAYGILLFDPALVRSTTVTK